MGFIGKLFREIKQNNLQRKVSKDRIALKENREEYLKIKQDFQMGNIGLLKYAFLLLKNKMNRNILSQRLAGHTEQYMQEKSDTKFKRDVLISDELGLSDANEAERRKRAKEGALHKTGKKSNLPGASIKSKVNGKEIVRYDHYNKKTHSAELDLDKPISWLQGTKRGLEMQIVDSISIKLDNNGKINLSLPENKQLLSTPGVLVEIMKKYPEAYATLPPDRAYGKDVIKAVREGAQDKIDSGKIPPNEDGSDKTVTEYQQQMLDMVAEKQREIEKQQAKQQQAHQQQTQTQQKFNNMENEF